MLEDKLAPPQGDSPTLELDSGSRVAVMGGGPAGCFFSYFLLDMAQRVDMDIHVDVYEPRDFSRAGPAGCNKCGGIVSELLVQTLATEGINLPRTVVQRGIDSYVLHMDVGSVRIATPLQEKRIGAVYRGPGPQDMQEKRWDSFDGYLQALAVKKGAHLVRKRVDDVSWNDGRPQLKTRDGRPEAYDLLAVAVGVNSPALELFAKLGFGYRPPHTTKTCIREYYLGEEAIAKYVGSSMHVFLLNIPRLKFAAIIPKGDYVTVCLLGKNIDPSLVQSFMDSPEVKACFPSDWRPDQVSCQCWPRLSIRGATRPFADRIVFLGDCGVTRLYKDGIGAAYRTAKAAAGTAIFQGISGADFRRHYWPACQTIGSDNTIGKAMFAVAPQVQKSRVVRRAMLEMSAAEQQKEGGRPRMSMALWDMFTGSAPYRDIFLRGLHPFFVSRFLWKALTSIFPRDRKRRQEVKAVGTGALGRSYADGEVIIRQGDVGDCMYVIQEGQVAVVAEQDGKEVRLAVLGDDDFFGEMALVEREVRSATVRALGDVRVLTVDKKVFLRRIQEDPSLAFRLVEKMSQRIRELNAALVRLKARE